MGVQDYLLASSILGVLAQRLVRRLCSSCRKEAPFKGLKIEGFEGEPPATLWEAGGCDSCNGTGYLGRIGIFELLPATPEICQLILQRADAASIRNLATRQGMRLLREDGWLKVGNGMTTLAEVLRVTIEEG